MEQMPILFNETFLFSWFEFGRIPDRGDQHREGQLEEGYPHSRIHGEDGGSRTNFLQKFRKRKVSCNYLHVKVLVYFYSIEK